MLTKLLTMILESPLPPAGPLGTGALPPVRGASLVAFFTPPTGAVVDFLAAFGARRPPRPRRAVLRRVLRISSRDLSKFPDMLICV